MNMKTLVALLCLLGLSNEGIYTGTVKIADLESQHLLLRKRFICAAHKPHTILHEARTNSSFAAFNHRRKTDGDRYRICLKEVVRDVDVSGITTPEKYRALVTMCAQKATQKSYILGNAVSLLERAAEYLSSDAITPEAKELALDNAQRDQDHRFLAHVQQLTSNGIMKERELAASQELFFAK